MTKNCAIIGSNSDIAKELEPRLFNDGWNTWSWNRKGWDSWRSPESWDLAVVCVGQITPVGKWSEIDPLEWESAVVSNLFVPLSQLHNIWNIRNPGSSVCFMAGANPNKPMENYSAYSVGKMALLKACEHLDLENQDCKLFALAPGTVLTKIHKATILSGVKNPVLERVMADGQDFDAKIDRIYECLKWCIEQPKNIIGGRNICVSDDWGNQEFAARLALSDRMLKLRRYETR